MGNLPITDVINVTITDTPSGLTLPNVNSLALFTNEAPANPSSFGDYGIYVSAAQVASDFGTNSVTTAMANQVFAQNPNILSGDGRLVIIPLIGSVSATSGNLVTADVSANLAALIAVTSGDIKFTIDGVAYNLTGLNFTGCVTLADIAAVIQKKLVNGVVTATTTQITVTSKKFGTTSTVAIAAVSGGTGTDLNGTGYLKGASAVATPGVNSSGETISTAITRTQNLVAYVGVMTNLSLGDTAVSAIAATVQALDMMFFHQGSSTADIAGIGTTIQLAGQTHTRFLVYTNDVASANLMKAAYASRGLSTDFTGSNTSTTLNLKQLVNVLPDANITQTLWAAAKVAGTDLYVSYAGVPSILSTGANKYFDEVYTDIALKFALETAGFNFLRQTNTKVPQTEQGMNGLKAAYANVLIQFVTNGSMAPGSWTSSETFGDPQIFLQNILTRGFYIYSLPIVQQNSSDRAQRKAPLVQIAVKRAGAIHSSDVLVIVNA